jgi:hypothetical protein
MATLILIIQLVVGIAGSLALTVHSRSIKYELISHKEKMNV